MSEVAAMRRRTMPGSTTIALLAVFAVFVLLFLAGVGFGSTWIGLDTVTGVLLGGGDRTDRLVVLQLRLPRVLAAAIAVKVAPLDIAKLFQLGQGSVGGGFGQVGKFGQAALAQAIFGPQDAQKNPVPEGDILLRQPDTERAREPARRKPRQMGDPLMAVIRQESGF